MKIHFDTAEIEQILIERANQLCQTGNKPFNALRFDSYTYISGVSIMHEPPEEPVQAALV
jgi:hypothetical protein